LLASRKDKKYQEKDRYKYFVVVIKEMIKYEYIIKKEKNI